MSDSLKNQYHFTENWNDVQLIQAVATKRDALAFQKLFDRHRKAALGLAFRLTGNRFNAEDVFQNVMLTVWKNASCYRQTGEVKSWILRIVALTSMRHTRDQHRSLKRLNRSKTLTHTHPCCILSELEQNEERCLLRAAYQRLPRSEQRMLSLYFNGGLSKKNICKSLDLPNSTLTYRVRSCLNKLRIALSN